jgi:ATP/maltotriose-dependent transcriptional regulator MalT
VDLMQRAIELSDVADADRGALVLERAGLQLWAGQIREAEAACRTLLDRSLDSAQEATARALLGRCLMTDGRMREAVGEFARVERSPAATGAERVASWGSASIAHVFLGQLDEAAVAAERAREAAAITGDEATASLSFTASATVCVFRAQLDDALGLVDEALRRAEASSGRRGYRYPSHMVRGHVLIELDRLADARAALETGMRLSEDLGVRWSLPAYQFMLAVARFAAGEWDEALSAVGVGLELGEEAGDRYNHVVGHCLVSLIALHRNDRQGAERAADAAAEELARGGPRYRSHWVQWTRALLLEADGHATEAYTILADCWNGLTESGMTIEYPMLGPDLVRLALVADDQQRAEQVTTAVASVAADNDVGWLDGAALRCRGLRDDDAEVLRGAVDTLADSPRPLDRALACEEAGASSARDGDGEAAVGLLDRALEVYDRLDAARDAARAHSALRALGVRRGRRGTRIRPQTGWESLTPTERTVTDLVAEGLSNPQIGERLFVSRRTVQTHVAHVFQKLQISSRSELAAAVTRHADHG